MRVFVTGASGWIGSAVVPELVQAGHEVVGLARSDASATAIAAAGARVHRGSIDDPEGLAAAAAAADGVVHLAFNHDFSDFVGAGHTERAVITALGDALRDSGKPLLFAAGLLVKPGQVVTENDPTPVSGPDSPRGGGEELALSYAEHGVRPVSLRFAPSVHGDGDHGFIKTLVEVARQRGVSGHVGDGGNRWAAVHRSDAARLVRLALERPPVGGVVHAVDEEAITARDIATAIGRGLDVPVASIAPDDVTDHFGWIGGFFSLDLPASSDVTRETLNWTPAGPGLLDDLATDSYFRDPATIG
ncbi:SDR family oxidoreductase [Williamsia sterculiae]|uniref:Nucleoside-diphosphate-sugar epimerase n=1 Tax=Williamsia sterculiae TaxID=1344003 RepID=A0A1N7GRZ0_9NOCA|nr:SDR family oxidoreductase [Williamsia sterculiae]SIS15332.1 Nucleoside-diphosphate-sugar epimerase [Williamsia sterculiae]